MINAFRRPRVVLRAAYNPAERITDNAIHVLGVLFALIAVPVMLTLAAVWIGDRVLLTGFAIYGLSIVAMFSCSAVYHMAPFPSHRQWLLRVDQSAIYFKIAGAQTPFSLLAGPQTQLYLTIIWGAALVGVALVMINPAWRRWPGLVLYLAIGWASVVLGWPMIEGMSSAGFKLIMAGGLIYSSGVIFFLWERLPFHKTIWHGFVLVATVLVYAAAMIELHHHAIV